MLLILRTMPTRCNNFLIPPKTLLHSSSQHTTTVWWSGVVVSALASINEVNLRRARLVLRWATVSGFNSRCRTFRYVTNQPPKANSAFHPSGVGKWVPASAGKGKAGMVHSVSGWTRGVQVKLPWERVPYLSALELRSWQGVIQIHVYLTLPYMYQLPRKTTLLDECNVAYRMLNRDILTFAVCLFFNKELIDWLIE